MRLHLRLLALTGGLVAGLLLTAAGCDGCRRQLARQAVAAVKRATKVDRGFHVSNGQVVYVDRNPGEGSIRRKVVEADAATFRACEQPQDAPALFAVDGLHVFMAELYRVVVIAEADPRSFELLTPDGRFSRDAKRVFYTGVALADADPASFRVVDPPFGKDEHRAYVGTIPIPVRDIASWRPLARGWTEDPWYRPHDEKFPRPHDELSSQGWSQDDDQVYWGHRPLAEADVASFKALDRFYAKDHRRVYFAQDVVQAADPATFMVYDGPFIKGTDFRSGPGPDACDAQRQYRSGRAFDR
jgi:hypothetical protein